MNCLGPAVSQSEWTLGAMLDQGLKMPTRLYRDIGPYVDWSQGGLGSPKERLDGQGSDGWHSGTQLLTNWNSSASVV